MSDPLTALGAINGVLQALKGFSDLKNEAKLNEAVIDLQTKILSLGGDILNLQAQCQDLREANTKMKTQLETNEKEESRKKEYRLCKWGESLVVGKITETEPSIKDVRYCPTCFEEGKIYPLNLKTAGTDRYYCHKCQFNIAPFRQRNEIVLGGENYDPFKI